MAQSDKNNSTIKLKRSTITLIATIAIIISAPIARTSQFGMWSALVSMILYLAANASFVSTHFNRWKELKTNDKIRLIIWCMAALISATTFIRHDFSFFSAIVILVIDYTLALSEE